MNKVYIVGGGGSYAAMFKSMGWELTDFIYEANLVQFTGGSDVSPHLYGEKKHPLTSNSEKRDAEEAMLYDTAKMYDLPCAGICRGGQFLNVMNGGKLWQHVDNHAIGHTHRCFSELLGGFVEVTSTHHQMMDAAAHGEIEGYVMGIAGPKQRMDGGTVSYCKEGGKDVEVVFYKNTNDLCFQPHPEFFGAHSTRNYYFKLLEHYFNLT